MTYDPANGYVYVPNYGSSNVSVFTGAGGATTVQVGLEPRMATLDAANGYVYVVNYGNATVSVIKGVTDIRYVHVGTDPWQATYDATNGYVYVVNTGSGNVTVLNGTTIVAKGVPVGSTPHWATYNSRNGYIYVSNSGSNNVSILNGTTIVKSVGSIDDPLLSAFDSSNGYIYVPADGSGTITVLNGTTNLTDISTGVGTQPQSATFDPWNGEVYVPAYAGGVNVISGTTSVLVHTAESTPIFAAYNPGNGDIYVSNTLGSTVAILNGTSPIGNVTVGADPHSTTYNPGNGDILVPNSVSNTLDMIGSSAVVAPCPSATAVTTVQVGIFQNLWVNWTDPARTSTGIVWGSSSGSGTNYNLPVPSLTNNTYSYSANLTGLQSNMAYQFVISVTGSYGSGATLAAFLTGVVPSRLFVAPFLYGTAWYSTGCDGYPFCGTNHIVVDSGNGTTGVMDANLNSYAQVYEGATASVTSEILQFLGEVPVAGEYAISFDLKLAWSATFIDICVPAGAGVVESASISFGINVINDYTGEGMINPYSHTVYSQSIPCPWYVWYWEGAPTFITSFNTYMVPGDEYLFQLQVTASTTALAVGLGGGGAAAAFGSPSTAGAAQLVGVGLSYA